MAAGKPSWPRTEEAFLKSSRMEDRNSVPMGDVRAMADAICRILAEPNSPREWALVEGNESLIISPFSKQLEEWKLCILRPRVLGRQRPIRRARSPVDEASYAECRAFRPIERLILSHPNVITTSALVSAHARCLARCKKSKISCE